jgi:hypothetical protein
MQAFSAKLRKLGISEQMAGGPTKEELVKMLDREGLNENLNKRRGPRAPAPRSASAAATPQDKAFVNAVVMPDP